MAGIFPRDQDQQLKEEMAGIVDIDAAETYWRQRMTFANHDELLEVVRQDWYDTAPFEFIHLLDAVILDEEPMIRADTGPAPAGYSYSPNVGRYRDSHGRFVAFVRILALLDGREQVTEDRMRSITESYQNGSIAGPEWHRMMMENLYRFHVSSAALGVGGIDNLPTKDLRRIADMLIDDSVRMADFGNKMGELSLGQIQNRIHMYVGKARAEFYLSQPLPTFDRRTQTVLERRILRFGDNCAFCIDQADKGWQPQGTLTVPGLVADTWVGNACYGNCRCGLERRVFNLSEASMMTTRMFADFVSDWRAEQEDPVGVRVYRNLEDMYASLVWKAGLFKAGERARWPKGDPDGRGGQFRASDEVPSTVDKVWDGTPVEVKGKKPSKQAVGKFGEQIARGLMSKLYGEEFKDVNDEGGRNNMAFDAVGSAWALEVKTGLASNGRSAMQWRATIGEPGDAEKAQMAQMDKDTLKAYNLKKMDAILERKAALLSHMSQKMGRELQPAMVGVILSPDGKAGDVYFVPGFHLNLQWKNVATDENYIGSYKVADFPDFAVKGMEMVEVVYAS